MLAAAIFVWISIIMLGKFTKVMDSFRDKRAISATFGGAVFGPFIGVWLSMIAVTYALAGVAATLMSFMPVMVIPVVWVLYKQKTTWRGFVGAVISVLEGIMLRQDSDIYFWNYKQGGGIGAAIGLGFGILSLILGGGIMSFFNSVINGALLAVMVVFFYKMIFEKRITL